MMRKFLSLCFYVLIGNVSSQCLSPVNFQQVQSIAAVPFPALHHDLTAKRDSFPAKPFLYIAGMERGLVIYNISNVNSPTLVATVQPANLNNLKVMNVTQQGSYLYLALGDHFNQNAENSGMAIIDVSSPATPTVKSVYTFTAPSGAGHVAVDGNYAFVAAMQNGILVLDVTSKTNPTLVSVYKPPLTFPKPNPTPSEIQKINARSMVIKNNIMYLCYDAGGVRIVNTTNKSLLKQTGKYSNPVLLNYPRAYNNLILDDSMVYVACDYAGMEVLKVKDTSNVTQISWWNPWLAGTPTNSWTNSPGHTNEIVFDKNCKMLFMSAGRSDVMAVSVANPLLPDSCSQFGSKADSLGTWGVGMYQNQLYLGYIVTPIPFYSNWSGVKIVTYNNSCITGLKETELLKNENVFPNPVKDQLTVKNLGGCSMRVTDVSGRLVRETKIISSNDRMDLSDLVPGIYFYRIFSEGKTLEGKFIKE